MRKSWASDIGFVVWKAGAVPAVRRIGRKLTETSTDMTTKGM